MEEGMYEVVEVYDDEVCTVKCQHIPEIGIVLHCDVHQWSKDRFIHLLSVWDVIREMFAIRDVRLLNVICDENNQKLRKFISVLGFKHSGKQVTFGEGYKLIYEHKMGDE